MELRKKNEIKLFFCCYYMLRTGGKRLMNWNTTKLGMGERERTRQRHNIYRFALNWTFSTIYEKEAILYTHRKSHHPLISRLMWLCLWNFVSHKNFWYSLVSRAHQATFALCSAARRFTSRERIINSEKSEEMNFTKKNLHLSWHISTLIFSPTLIIYIACCIYIF